MKEEIKVATLSLAEHSKKMDALVSGILELCEKEGVTMFELKCLGSRLERKISEVLEQQERETEFRFSGGINPNVQG